MLPDHGTIMTVTESMDDADQEKATEEPLAPGTTPESEPANTTDGPHIHGIPEVFSDIEDHFIPLQTPLTTSKNNYNHFHLSIQLLLRAMVIVNGCHIMISFLGFVISFNLLIRCHEWYLFLVKGLAERLKTVFHK